MRSGQDHVTADTRNRWRRYVRRAAFPMLVLTAIAACTDPTSPTAAPSSPSLNRSEGRRVFQRYVALGSGMSMGWQSDGVTEQSQYDSWPAQLARMAHRDLDQPYVATPTCLPPILTPFESFTRAPSGPCANAKGVVLPTQNLAYRGATVSSALMAMVGGAVMGDSGFGFTSVMPLVLPPGVTQVGALRALKPKIVSVEFGTSEILRPMQRPEEHSPLLIPSDAAWSAMYDKILDEVSKSTDVVVLALPPRLVPPGFVYRTTLAASLAKPEVLARYNLAPLEPWCDLFVQRGVYVPRYLQLIVAEAVAAKAAGLGPVPLRCVQLSRADLSFSYDIIYDFIATAVERMRKHIQQQADLRGFAYFDMNVLYDASVQPPFDVMKFMTSDEPFGPYVSIDGIYPTRAGNALLAEAAARALNERYGLGIPVSASASRQER